MKPVDLLVAAILVLITVLAVRGTIARKKRGGCSYCSGGCSGCTGSCTGCGACARKKD